MKLFAQVTGWKAQMCGPSIAGFGAYRYTYDTGPLRFDVCPRFQPAQGQYGDLCLRFPGKAELLNKLGRHKGALGQCLYINKLADVDMAILEKILKGGVAEAKKMWSVSAAWRSRGAS